MTAGSEGSLFSRLGIDAHPYWLVAANLEPGGLNRFYRKSLLPKVNSARRMSMSSIVLR
jgi:hypothetical protein